MAGQFFLEQSKRSYVFDLVRYFFPYVGELILKIKFYGIYFGEWCEQPISVPYELLVMMTPEIQFITDCLATVQFYNLGL